MTKEQANNLTVKELNMFKSVSQAEIEMGYKPGNFLRNKCKKLGLGFKASLLEINWIKGTTVHLLSPNDIEILKKNIKPKKIKIL